MVSSSCHVNYLSLDVNYVFDVKPMICSLICLSTLSLSSVAKSVLCYALVLQDLVCKTFSEFWFEEPPASQTQVFGDGSTVPLDIVKKTEQIVEMLRGMPNNQLLVTVIKRNLSLDFLPQSAKAVGVNPVSLAIVRKRCELMCKCLLEKMLQV